MADYSRNFKNLMGGMTGIFNEDISINAPDESINIDTNLSGDPGTGDPKKNAKVTKIPLPNYKDSASRLNYAKEFTNRYGPLMSGRGDTPLRINEYPGTGTDPYTSKQLVDRVAPKLGLDPAILYASAMEEGMSGLYPNQKNMVKFSGNKEYPISGYVNFGLDTFSDAYPDLVKKGYLPEDFNKKFTKRVHPAKEGDNKVPVNSADFKSLEAALEAKSAMIKASSDELNSYLEKSKTPLSDKGKQFFELVAYNAGIGNAQKMLEDYKKAGVLKDDAFLKDRPKKGPGLKENSWSQPYENAIRRIKMAEALKNEGYFHNENPDNASMNKPKTTTQNSK
jgi:hypothetical protein